MNIRAIIKETLNRIFEMSDNYPVGANDDSSAPWNEKQRKVASGHSRDKDGMLFICIGFYPNEIAILSGPEHKKFAFYFNALDSSDLENYVDREIVNTSKGWDEGDVDHEYSDNWNIDAEVIQNYVNANYASMSQGVGKTAWEAGVDLVEIDEALKHDLLNVYGKNQSIEQALK